VDGATLAAYSTDASNHRLVPRCVVFPRRTEDVIAVIEACAGAGVPVTSRGAGTGLAGGALGSGVVLDYSRRFNRIVHVDAQSRRAVVEPGVVLDSLQRRAVAFGLRFGPDPATHSRCTLGGMIGTNACGARALAWGTTSANVRAVDVVLADGSTATLGSEHPAPMDAALGAVGDRWSGPIAAELGRFGRQVSGYALQHLLPGRGFDPAKAFVGSEGTWGQLVSATVDLVEVPAKRMLVVAGYSDIIAAAAAASVFPAAGALTVEGIGVDLVDAFDASAGPRSRVPPLPAGSAWLLVEIGGTTDEECAERAEAAVALAAESGAHQTWLVTDPEQQRALWTMREHGAGLASRTGGAERWPGWEDAAVPPLRLAAYLSDFSALLRERGRTGTLYGHFGEGCVHVRIDHDLVSETGRRAYAEFQRAAADLVVAHGGSLSGEHGDGRARSELLAKMYSPEVLAAFAAAKAVFDPGNLFNPGLVVDPVPLDGDLRLSLVRRHRDDLAFAYSDDGGDFAAAQRRCVGVGSCRASGGGMCPSYQATLDERHSTRGRARVLFEMLDGSLSGDGWRSPDVLGALDLCLMCKACSSECPVSVDMATYKAEFLHQHYRRRLRPRSHLSMGWLPVWLAIGRRAPRWVNATLRSPRLAPVLSRLAGLDPRRELPQLAPHPVSRSTRRSSASGSPSDSPVVLWLDTFTSTFFPDVVDDAVAVLQAAGCSVDVAGGGLCCGLTWLSTGQLSIARMVLARTVAALDSRTDGSAIVVLEPSCAAALREDAVKLLDSAAAQRVANRIRSLADVLDTARLPAGPPRSGASLKSPVVAQFHCHQRATSGTQNDRDLLSRLGFDVTSVEEGCCGLAGNFGFEDGHYDVSRRCAEQSFLPYLHRMPGAEVLADGFSCRLQMEQLGAAPLAGRRPVHLASLVRRRLAV
jgi:FAD/FMN-containing dehydrogenase/Fe-S oxidoreductase